MRLFLAVITTLFSIASTAPTNHVTVTAPATSYTDCSKLRENSLQSIQADVCVLAIDDGKKAYVFDFKYPTTPSKGPTENSDEKQKGAVTSMLNRTGDDKPLIVTVSSMARSYSDCGRFLEKGNDVCMGYPKYLEDETTPSSEKCIKVNVA
ncbi:hypothetical protein BC829DRAFT_422407 [Chytridium lagenaria]|nr:hypothetical protein BC829DRAFT_422407 [Chytridium lagenaria]